MPDLSGWRPLDPAGEIGGWVAAIEVPVDPSVCGEQAKATMPRIEQVFVNARDTMPRGSFNRKLKLSRV